MIPKDCPLNDKSKLQATLKTECLLEEVSEKLSFCKECPYSAEKKRQQKYSTANFKEEMKQWLTWMGLKDDDTEKVSNKQ
jgi:hypothetical protein